MKTPIRALVTALAVAVVATALLAPIASAGGSTTRAATNGMMGGGGAWSGTGMWGAGAGMQWLTDNRDALEAWLQMRTAHHQAMQGWYDTYATDLTSTAAQQALHDIWTTFWLSLIHI